MVKNLFIQIIKLYKKYISPMKRTKCPYFPSCSDYGLEAIEVNGPFIGSLLALWRIIRCNPFIKGKYDPVPKIRKRYQ